MMPLILVLFAVPLLNSRGGALAQIGSILVYEAACAIFLPLPSELPMFLFPSLSRFSVAAACAIGKVLGAYLVFLIGGGLTDSKWTKLFLSRLKILAVYDRILVWSARVMNTYGYFGFLFLMSIPAMPMRTSIYGVSVLRINRPLYLMGVGIGTVIRNFLVYGGYIGIKSLTSGI